jgi:hypothetical protein
MVWPAMKAPALRVFLQHAGKFGLDEALGDAINPHVVGRAWMAGTSPHMT